MPDVALLAANAFAVEVRVFSLLFAVCCPASLISRSSNSKPAIPILTLLLEKRSTDVCTHDANLASSFFSEGYLRPYFYVRNQIEKLLASVGALFSLDEDAV